MGNEGDQVSVQCDCGREIRVRRSLMRVAAKCPVCGALVALPEPPVAGPLCPHCGRPWPTNERRCPSCMARSRTPGASPQSDAETAFAGGRPPREPRPPRPVYPGQRDLPPASVRVKYWHQKPTIHGWTIAAGIAGIVALVVLGGTFNLGGACWWVGGVMLLIAIGMFRGDSRARNVLLATPILAAAAGTGAMFWLAPQAVSVYDMVWAWVMLALAVGGLSAMTAEHGRWGKVLVAAAVTASSLTILLGSVDSVVPDQTTRAAMADRFFEEWEKMVPKEGGGRSLTPEAPDTPTSRPGDLGPREGCGPASSAKRPECSPAERAPVATATQESQPAGP
jgi:hypothetical protein